MVSTFQGLETARRGMFTQQSALNTTGQNIANANTPGYSRQRVNFEQTEPYPPASMNRPQIPGQTGTGVQAGSVQRVRETFLDVQYRGENNSLGYWQSRADSLEKMEEIMNEPSETGLSKTLDRFWQSLQDLAVNPSNAGARSVVRQRGMAVAETFNYLSDSLQSIQQDLKTELDITVKEVNSIANQLNNVNKQIGEIEPHGYLPNDLYDERDRLMDQLSSLVDVKVTPVKSGGNALEIADGKFTVEILDPSGNAIGTLVDATTNNVNTMTINYNATNTLVESFDIGSSTGNLISSFTSSGELRSLIDSYGYTDSTGTTESGLYPEMLQNLDEMAYTFATEFNRVHNAGWSISNIDEAANGVTPKTEYNFFEIDPANKAGTADRIKLDQDIINSLDNIAAAGDNNGSATLGDGSNAVALGAARSGLLMIDGNSTTIQSYYESVIGGMAVNAQEANRLSNNSDTLRQAVDDRRQSVSAVSIDEEMTNMIKFQHAYNASARMITVTDELLDKIINGMGRAGR